MSVVVLGGGIGGLSAAYYLLKRRKYQVTLIDASAKVGGWIKSEIFNNGIVFEQGPRTLRIFGEAGYNTLGLIDELGLGNDIKAITNKHPAFKNRFIYAKQNLCHFPTNFSSLFRRIPPFSKPLYYAITQDFWNRNRPIQDDDSIYEFAKRRYGTEIADYLVSSVVCGICAGNAKDISVHFLFSDLYQKEQKHGSVIRGVFKELFRKKDNNISLDMSHNPLVQFAIKNRWRMYTFKNGLQSLPNALSEKVKSYGGTILTDSPCTKIDLANKLITISNNDERHYDHLICTVPPPALSAMVDDTFLKSELLKIPYVNVITVNLAYQGPLLDIDGFGFLVPPIENLPILGVIFDSCYMDIEGWTVLTVLMGGYAFEKYFGSCSEDKMLTTAIEHVDKILRITQKPDFYRVSVLRNCIPQYIVGHKNRVENIFSYIKQHKLPLSLAGSAYNGVGVNDVILSSRKCVENLSVFE